MGIATKNPVKIVENEGVLYFGWIRENILGNKPSRLILIQILGCPNWNTSKTLAVAIIALTATIPAMNFNPCASNTIARGSPDFPSSEYFTIPVSTSASNTYTMEQMIRELIMPLGRSRWGFLHSSAVVEIASKPIYAKKTAETPFIIPENPLGVNGDQLSGLM